MSISARDDEPKRDLAKAGGKTTPKHHARQGLNHGREAGHPVEIPARGWVDILWRVWREISDANLFLIAGGVTYTVLLAYL